MGSQPETLRLYTLIQDGEISPDAVFQQISRLSSVAVDARYENPHDIALVTYLWSLLRYSPTLARAACEMILATNGLYWSYKLASRIIENRSVHGESGSQYAVYLEQHPTVPHGDLASNNMIVSPIVPALTRQKEKLLVSEPTSTGVGVTTSNLSEFPTLGEQQVTSMRAEAKSTASSLARAPLP